MDFDAARFWFEIFQAAALAGVWIFSVISRRNQASKGFADDLNTRLSQVEERLTHMPQQTAFQELRVSVEGIHGEIGGLSDNLVRIEKQVHLLTQHLLEKKS